MQNFCDYLETKRTVPKKRVVTLLLLFGPIRNARFLALCCTGKIFEIIAYFFCKSSIFRALIFPDPRLKSSIDTIKQSNAFQPCHCYLSLSNFPIF